MNKYITVMFPYPSGEGLHVGHWYNYAIVNTYCNLERYLGNTVYQPFGFDSFGLPAENYAIKIGGNVKEITETNIINFQKEMQRMNTSFEYKFSTHAEEYQKKTQWLFSELYKKGLAYKAFREQDWCESCKTVLAREQVKEGKCDRCSSKTIKKELNQWFFKITDYKQRLIDDLDLVDYPQKTKKQQLHWLENLTDWCVSRQRKWGCAIPIEGEIDTLDTFVDSSFYTIEYDKTRAVDLYVGGNEHACMHLIYSRFITKFLFDIGYINFKEPFKQVIHQGMILKDGEKMSKSKGNIVNPKDYNPTHLKMYLMFINHYFEGGSWNDSNFIGIERFDNKIQNWFNNARIDGEYIDWSDLRNNVINYFKAWKTNKVISEWMIFYNKNKNKTLNISCMKELKEFYDILK
jgi:leucyl-tRNA synthetase